jgi:hypothetical protein
MNKLSFALGSAYIALLAGILVGVDQLIHQFMPFENNNGFVYLAFVAWAIYFFAGATVKGGIKAAIGYLVGIAFSIAIMLLAGVFTSLGFFAIPLAVVIVIFPVLYLEKVPWFDLLPAAFPAAGCFFGIMTYVPGASFGTATGTELVYGLLGLLFGWISIAGRGVIYKTFK